MRQSVSCDAQSRKLFSFFLRQIMQMSQQANQHGILAAEIISMSLMEAISDATTPPFKSGRKKKHTRRRKELCFDVS